MCAPIDEDHGRELVGPVHEGLPEHEDAAHTGVVQ